MLINVTVFQRSGISPPLTEPSVVAGFCGRAGAAALCVGISVGAEGTLPVSGPCASGSVAVGRAQP